MKSYLDNIVNYLLKREKEGQRFFTALDKSVQHPYVLRKLLEVAPKNNYIIVSGGFGKFVRNQYKSNKLWVMPGGIRYLNNFSLESCQDFIKNKDFIFLDDSYYSGKTYRAIQREIEKYKGNFKHVYCVYDGAQFKNKQVASLFRYHERF